MIKEVTTKEEMDKALEVRYEVQLKPQGIPRKDVQKHDKGEDTVTLIFLENEKVLASATAFIMNKTEVNFVYLAVLPTYQGKGLGKQMVKAMEKVLKKRGIKKVSIFGRTYLEHFYSSLGYKPQGNIHKVKGFVEKGIFHQHMIKHL